MSIEELSNPIPQGKYVPANRFGDLIYTAGMTPRHNGALILTGKVSSQEPVEEYRLAVILAAKNALKAACNMISEGETISKVLAINVFINAENGYASHSKIADFASEYLFEELGDKGIGSRTAVGVESLPGNAPVEIQLIVAVERV